MRVGWLAGAVLSLFMLGRPAMADDSSLYDCGERKCDDWAANGDKTCRTCKTPQCKKENGGEVLAGEKKQTECYDGHGSPPN